LERNTVTGNSTSGQYGYGGGVYLDNSQTGPNNGLESNTISGNTTTGSDANGGGVALYSSGNSALRSNTVSSNHASGTNAYGGGVKLTDSPDCILHGNDISANTCGANGGGMNLGNSGGAVLTSNTVTNNTANDTGGIRFYQSSDCTMRDCVILGNQAIAGTSSGVYVCGPSSNMSLAGDPNSLSYNIIGCCLGAYSIYNENPYDDSGVNDVDARHNVWCTEDAQVIQECIYDYFDDGSKAFVYFHPFCERIPGDVNDDWCVDLADLTQLLAHYGMTSGAVYEDGDLDGDGDVDLGDLTALLAHYGKCCPPCR
jgi:hypothetical protein